MAKAKVTIEKATDYNKKAFETACNHSEVRIESYEKFNENHIFVIQFRRSNELFLLGRYYESIISDIPTN